MRIAIISDVHANLAALESIQEPYDLLLCLGDLVDYGPQPHEAIQWVRERALKVVRGNHDHALAFDADCGCASTMKEASVATRHWHWSLLSPDEKEYLGQLPITEDLELAGAKFRLAHGSPAGDLYDYHLVPYAPAGVLVQKTLGIDADFILLGHTHLPMLRVLGKTVVVNPGSLGQPRHGDPRASYAIWEDGDVKFYRSPYDLNRTIAALEQAPLPDHVITRLVAILRTGSSQGY